MLAKAAGFFHANDVTFAEVCGDVEPAFTEWFGNQLLADCVVKRTSSPRQNNTADTNTSANSSTARYSNTMDDPAKRAAIMNFPLPASSASSSQSPSSASSSSVAGKTLSSQYNAMMMKRGKKTFPKACEGAAKCKNVLCEHKFVPVGALTQSFGGGGGGGGEP